MIVLMFIGASPGSTGGGVKTTSASLLFLIMWSRLRGREEVNVFNRTIPRELLQRAISIILASSLFDLLHGVDSAVFGGLRRAPGRKPAPLRGVLFETVSAFGTVGLSMNLTPELNTPQKLAIILMMFVGRVGPLTLAFSLARMTGRKGHLRGRRGHGGVRRIFS